MEKVIFKTGSRRNKKKGVTDSGTMNLRVGYGE